MKNLRSMTAFVISQNFKFANGEIDINKCGLSILKYANFLLQPLELGMFVPCDEKGNILEESGMFKILGDVDGDFEQIQYETAKGRCLFEGFELVPFSNSVRKGNYIIDFNYTENINVESLLHHDIEFELTPTAQKQL